MDNFFPLFFLVIALVINVLLMVWAYRDAESRGQNGCLVAALIYFAGIPGIIIWLLIRDSLAEKYSSSTSVYTRKCPYCAEYIKTDANVCRYCGNKVDPAVRVPEPAQKIFCPDCGTACLPHLAFCPRCSAPLQEKQHFE
jgi:hypothetical protein